MFLTEVEYQGARMVGSAATDEDSGGIVARADPRPSPAGAIAMPPTRWLSNRIRRLEASAAPLRVVSRRVLRALPFLAVALALNLLALAVAVRLYAPYSLSLSEPSVQAQVAAEAMAQR